MQLGLCATHTKVFIMGSGILLPLYLASFTEDGYAPTVTLSIG